jgi:cobyrinic acid a,c-diamide synthase
MVQQYLDVQAIKDIAATAMGMQVPRAFVTSKSRVCRIAVADDTAMNQMFQENLDLLKREGADLVAFSPQSDDKLPAHVRAIYLPGGRLEKYAESLSANAAMKEAIQSFVREKGVIFAEGSSLAYLFSNVATAKGVNLPMLGIIKGTATFLNTEPEMDKLIFAAESSRPNFLLHDKEKMWGLRPARWAYRVEEQIQFAFRALTTKQVDATEKELEENPPVMDGFMPRQNVLGTAYQFSWSTNPIVAERFVKFSLGEGR